MKMIASRMTKQNKQVVVLYVTSVIGMLVGILNSVLNTRSLAPNLYGDVRYVQNIISFVSSLLLFGFFNSGSRLLALSKNEQHSRDIRGVMCVILAITIFAVMLVMTILYFASQGKNDSISALYLIAIPFCGNVLMLNYVNTTAQGDNHIYRIAAARLLPSALYFIIAYFIYTNFGATPVRMLLLYNGIAVISLFLIITSTRPSFKNLKYTFSLLKEENKSYGFNIYLGSLIAVSTGYIAGITLGKFCGDNSNVGFYTLAQTLAMPLSMLPSIIGTTYFRRFASQGKIDRKVLVGSFGLTILSCVVFILFIKYVVFFLYDESYYCVAKYASYIAIGTSVHGLGDMFNRFLGSHGQGKQIRNAAFVCGIVLVTGSVVLVYYYQVKGAIITKIISSSAYFSMMLYYYLQFAKKDNCKDEIVG